MCGGHYCIRDERFSMMVQSQKMTVHCHPHPLSLERVMLKVALLTRKVRAVRSSRPSETSM